MNMIAAVDRNWAIGRQGKLLAHLSGDLKYFRQKTLGKHIVIGRKTLESFPGGKPLPDRDNIVLTTDPGYRREGCRICHSLAELDDCLGGLDPDDVFVAGGETIYRQLLSRCATFYITHIESSFAGADAHFPDLTVERGIGQTWRSEEQREDHLRYYFAKYQRENG